MIKFPKHGSFILPVVLVIVAAISALAVDFIWAARVNITSLVLLSDSRKAAGKAKSAVLAAVYALKNDSTGEKKTVNDPIFDKEVVVTVEDEGGKFNINSIVFLSGDTNEDALKGLRRILKFLKIAPKKADIIADWIDPDGLERGGNFEQGAKNSYLDDIIELAAINGITADDFHKIEPYLTVYGDGRININSAPAGALVSLSDEISEESAWRIVEYRARAPFAREADIMRVPGLEEAGINCIGKISVKSDFFMLKTEAASGRVVKKVCAIVELKEKNCTIKSWREK